VGQNRFHDTQPVVLDIVNEGRVNRRLVGRDQRGSTTDRALKGGSVGSRTSVLDFEAEVRVGNVGAVAKGNLNGRHRSQTGVARCRRDHDSLEGAVDGTGCQIGLKRTRNRIHLKWKDILILLTGARIRAHFECTQEDIFNFFLFTLKF